MKPGRRKLLGAVAEEEAGQSVVSVELLTLQQLNCSNMTSIHDLVAATLSELGLPAPANIIQTMLMNDGHFVGWKFRYDGGHAILQAEANSVELYDEQGTLLKTVSLEEERGAAA